MIKIIIIKDENKLTSGVISSKFRYLNPESLFLFFKFWKIFSNLVRTILSLFFSFFFRCSRLFINSRGGWLKYGYVKDRRHIVTP